MISFLSFISELLPIMFFLIFLKRNMETALWVIFVYSIISFITEFCGPLLKNYKEAHFYIYSSFTIIEYSLFSLFLYLQINSKLFKRLILLGSVVFLILGFYNMVKMSNNSFDSLPASIESVFVIFYSILLLFESLNFSENSYINSSKTFWIVIAILIYLSATLILFISSTYLSENERRSYWPINSIANIVKNLLFSIAFIKKTKSRETYLSKSLNIPEKQH